jgi:AMIN domain
MKLLLRNPAWPGLLLLAPLGLWPAAAQSPPQLMASTETSVQVNSVRGISAYDGPAVEIITNHPIVPAIRKLDHPSRLVIDLPNATLAGARRDSDFHSVEVAAIRVNQFRQTPPVTRIVVDLVKPVTFSWDAAGNRLMVRLRPTEAEPVVSIASSLSPTSPVMTVPMNSTAPHEVSLTASRVPDGGSITAGLGTTVVRLERGGEVRVCPGTTVSVTTSRSGHALMLAMSTGAMEAHYSLDAAADSIVTPDFRILLAGPGEFDYGISADSRGNTCIQALPGNTASVIVSELLGDGTYQVKPSEQVMFHSGQLRGVDRPANAACGCPATPSPVMLASSTGKEMETAPLPPSKSNEIHVQVDVPFVFNAKDAPAPAPAREAALLPPEDPPGRAWFVPVVLAPRPPEVPHRGVLAKIRHFFAAIFS